MEGLKQKWSSIAEEVVNLLEEKISYYGNTYDIIQEVLLVYLSRYKQDDVYVIPKNILEDLLTVIRISDKIFRIVGGNKGKESAWIDIIGYALLAEEKFRRRKGG